MHIIDTKMDIHTDLLMDTRVFQKCILEEDGVSLFHASKDKNHYSTIGFIDITDKDQRSIASKYLIRELKDYINKKSKILIVGLGNRDSTPDALGPKTLDKILVTRHLFSFGDVEDGYSCVSIFEPNVFGSTGINSVELIKKVVELVNPEVVIIIDSLCTSSMERLNHTIQITDSGISPGSGVFNDRGELSSNTLGCCVIAIGVPTVVDINALLNNKSIEDMIVTPKDIDSFIDNITYVIGDSINKVLHESYISTK